MTQCIFEPIAPEVVVPEEVSLMTIENDTLRADLRAWLKSPAIGLPVYSADLVVQRRVGRIIGKCDAFASAKGTVLVRLPK